MSSRVRLLVCLSLAFSRSTFFQELAEEQLVTKLMGCIVQVHNQTYQAQKKEIAFMVALPSYNERTFSLGLNVHSYTNHWQGDWYYHN